MFNFIKKTFSGLNKTRKNIVNTFSKFHGKKYLNEQEIDELESILFQSDLSYEIVDNIINEFRGKTLGSDESWEDRFIDLLKKEISINDIEAVDQDRIILVIGVNGTG